MADIYSRMNQIMDSMLTVFNHLKKNCFCAVNDIEFEMSFRRVRSFFNLTANEAALFTYIFVNYYDCNERPVNIGILADNAGANPMRFLEFRDEFKSLEEKGFIKADSTGDSVSASEFYRVTEGVVEAILKNDESLLTNLSVSRDLDLIYPENIKEKQLFYMESIKKDVEALSSYLKKDSFNAIQDRLSEKALPRGVCIMLHGDAGTGKTETVYQLARLSNRPIYHVDLGAATSQWHGGTINNLTAIFKKYDKICEKQGEKGLPSVVSEAVVVVRDDTVHVVGKELLLLLGVDDESVQGELRVAVHASDEPAVLVGLRACPARDGPGLEETEFLAAFGTFESVTGRQQLRCRSCSCHFRCKRHICSSGLINGYSYIP